MASEDLTLRMRTRGAKRTQRDLDDTSRSVKRAGDSMEGTGKKAKQASRNVGIFSKSLELLQTRAVFTIVTMGALGGVLLVTVVPAVLLLIAALVSLAGVFLPVFAIGIAAVAMFKEKFDQAGTTAYELAARLKSLKKAAQFATNPAAAVAMRGLMDAIGPLIPFLRELRAPLASFAREMSAAMLVAAKGVASLGPEIRRLLMVAGPAMMAMARSVGPMLRAFLTIATLGMPVLILLVNWITTFSDWLTRASWNIDAWVRSGRAMATLGPVLDVITGAARWVVDVFSELYGISRQLWEKQMPLVIAIGGALLGMLGALPGVLGWINDNFDTLWLLLGPMVATLLALKLAALGVGAALKIQALWLARARIAWALYGMVLTAAWIASFAYAAAQWAVNIAMAANPIGLLAIAIGLLIIALAALAVYARNNWDEFKAAVERVWNVLRWSPLFIVANLFYMLGRAVWDARDDIARAFTGIWDGLTSGLLAAINWAITQINRLIGAYNRLPVGDIPQLPLLEGAPGLADGGTIRASGTTLVGERGPELLDLPKGAQVTPLDRAPSGPREVIINLTATLDGAAVSRAVYRHALQRKATA